MWGYMYMIHYKILHIYTKTISVLHTQCNRCKASRAKNQHTELSLCFQNNTQQHGRYERLSKYIFNRAATSINAE